MVSPEIEEIKRVIVWAKKAKTIPTEVYINHMTYIIG